MLKGLNSISTPLSVSWLTTTTKPHTHEKIDCEDSVADAQREMRAECTIATTAIVPHVGILSEGKVDRGLKLISPRWQILYNFAEG